MTAKKWKHNITDYSSLDKDKLAFILEESKQRLKSSIDCSDSLDKKSIFIISYFIAAITASIGYILAKYNYQIPFKENITLFLPVIFYLLSNMGLICLALIKIMPLSYYPLGNEPAKLLRQDICNQKFEKIITAYLNSLQNQITENSSDNKLKAKTVKLCINLAVFTLVVSIVIFAIIAYLY